MGRPKGSVNKKAAPVKEKRSYTKRNQKNTPKESTRHANLPVTRKGDLILEEFDFSSEIPSRGGSYDVLASAINTSVMGGGIACTCWLTNYMNNNGLKFKKVMIGKHSATGTVVMIFDTTMKEAVSFDITTTNTKGYGCNRKAFVVKLFKCFDIPIPSIERGRTEVYLRLTPIQGNFKQCVVTVLNTKEGVVRKQAKKEK